MPCNTHVFDPIDILEVKMSFRMNIQQKNDVHTSVEILKKRG